MGLIVLILATFVACSQGSVIYGGSRILPVRVTSYRAADPYHNNHGPHQMAGYGSPGYGQGRMNDNHGHGSSRYGHSHQCTCGIGEVCREDSYGRSYCQPASYGQGGPSHRHGHGHGSGSGQCMYLDYPTNCLRPRVRGAVTRFAYSHGRCQAVTVSNVASYCRPRGVANNIFASRYACDKYCGN